MKRVVITGIGAVTPLGSDFETSWTSIKNSVSGLGKLSRISCNHLRWQAAGEVSNLDSKRYLSKKEANFVEPFSLFAIAAATEALENSGLKIGCDNIPDKAGIIIGSSRGGISTVEKELTRPASTGKTSHHRLSPHLMAATTVSAASSFVAMKLGIHGSCLGISNACTSGLNAVGEAYRLIKHGLAQVVLAGGAEAPLCRICIEGYGSAGALSKSDPSFASRPFDIDRDGFVPAEGSGILVLEELNSALARKAVILAEIIGYSNSCDASHLTKPSDEGEAKAITEALADASITAADVSYINAHGTSTKIGDLAEARAIRRVFGDRRVPVSAIKSMTGHMLAASGAFEIACTAMSIYEGLIPPTINTKDIDPECNVNVVRDMTCTPIEIAISNSFGFGGLNAVLVLKKF